MSTRNRPQRGNKVMGPGILYRKSPVFLLDMRRQKHRRLRATIGLAVSATTSLAWDQRSTSKRTPWCATLLLSTRLRQRRERGESLFSALSRTACIVIITNAPGFKRCLGSRTGRSKTPGFTATSMAREPTLSRSVARRRTSLRDQH